MGKSFLPLDRRSFIIGCIHLGMDFIWLMKKRTGLSIFPVGCQRIIKESFSRYVGFSLGIRAKYDFGLEVCSGQITLKDELSHLFSIPTAKKVTIVEFFA